MLEVHEMENARRSNNPRAFKNVRGNTHATNITLPQLETRTRILITNGSVAVGRSPRSCPIAIDPTALETNTAALPGDQVLLKKKPVARSRPADTHRRQIRTLATDESGRRAWSYVRHWRTKRSPPCLHQSGPPHACGFPGTAYLLDVELVADHDGAPSIVVSPTADRSDTNHTR
jgi:hypothetical protein